MSINVLIFQTHFVAKGVLERFLKQQSTVRTKFSDDHGAHVHGIYDDCHHAHAHIHRDRHDLYSLRNFCVRILSDDFHRNVQGLGGPQQRKIQPQETPEIPVSKSRCPRKYVLISRPLNCRNVC